MLRRTTALRAAALRAVSSLLRARRAASSSSSSPLMRGTARDPAALPTALTFDDVLLVPQYSAVRSRRDVSLRTRLSRNIALNVPIVSSNMDTVTEARMAIAMARLGGIGIIHRFLSIEEQARMIARVKRAESRYIDAPFSLPRGASIDALRAEVRSKGVSSFLIVDADNRLCGIVTKRDMRFVDGASTVDELMTPRDKLVVGSPDISIEAARSLLREHRLEKLPLVDRDNKLCGLITAKDLVTQHGRPNASLDAKGRLMVGGALGVKSGYVERAAALIDAGVDVLVVDIAHGHSSLAIETTRDLKRAFPSVDVIAGNVATGDGVRDLVEAGADGIKVGVGPGSICITRIVTGSGVPQLSAVMDAAAAAAECGVPIMADGGIRTSGDLTKALAAGADTVMLGSMLAGTDESPGASIVKDGKRVKIIRGMAGIGANVSKLEREGEFKDDVFEIVPEGVEAVVTYKGAVADVVNQLVGGLRSGVSYCGSHSLAEMRQKARFVRMTGAGLKESGAHDVQKM